MGPLEKAEKLCQSFSAKLAIICQIQMYVDESESLQKAKESLMKCDERGIITDAKEVMKEIENEIGMIDTTLTFFGDQVEKKMGVSA